MEDSVLVPLLQRLFVPGSLGIGVGVILSFVVEFWPAFDEQSPLMKRLWFFGVCFLVSALAGVVIAAIKGEWNYDPIIGNALVASLSAWSSGTLAHGRTLPNG